MNLKYFACFDFFLSILPAKSQPFNKKQVIVSFSGNKSVCTFTLIHTSNKTSKLLIQISPYQMMLSLWALYIRESKEWSFLNEKN